MSRELPPPLSSPPPPSLFFACSPCPFKLSLQDHASPPSPRVIRLCAPPTSSWRARLGRLREVIQSGGDGAGLYASYYEEEDDVMAGEGALGEDEVPGQDDDA